MLEVGAGDWAEPGCWLTQETDPAPLLMKVNGRRFQEGPVLGRVRLSCNINWHSPCGGTGTRPSGAPVSVCTIIYLQGHSTEQSLGWFRLVLWSLCCRGWFHCRIPGKGDRSCCKRCSVHVLYEQIFNTKLISGAPLTGDLSTVISSDVIT